jgi:hypothetical protein
MINHTKNEKEELIAVAKHAKYYCDLLIKQCENSLRAESNLRNTATNYTNYTN